MKITSLFTLILTVILGLAVSIPQSAEAGERRKTLSDCVHCKRPVYSYYKFKTYKDNQPVYDWVTSGHSKCGPKIAVAKPVVVKSIVEKSTSTKTKAGAAVTPYARHGESRAYGGGSGYVEGGYGGAYGGVYYGNAFRPEYGYGAGYGSGTVIRRTTVTRPTMARGIFGGFSGTSTRTYTTRTRVSRRGSFGGIRGGGSYGRPGICHY